MILGRLNEEHEHTKQFSSRIAKLGFMQDEAVSTYGYGSRISREDML